MKYIKTYELFGGLKKFFTREPKLPKVYNTTEDIINDYSLSHSDKLLKIKDLCRKYRIYTPTINDDYSVSTHYVNMSGLNQVEVPIKFKLVDGTFDVSNNQITTFKNFPISCRYMDASNNNIVSLKGCPQTGTLRLKNNRIESLEGICLGADFIDLGANNISDLTLANDLEYGNSLFSVVENNVTEFYPIRSSNPYVTDTPLWIFCLYLTHDYPDYNWIESFNSYNIIYNDGKGPTKVFSDNLDNYLSQNKMIAYRTKNNFIDRLKEVGYEVTTMSEYFKQKPENEI